MTVNRLCYVIVYHVIEVIPSVSYNLIFHAIMMSSCYLGNMMTNSAYLEVKAIYHQAIVGSKGENYNETSPVYQDGFTRGRQDAIVMGAFPIQWLVNRCLPDYVWGYYHGFFANLKDLTTL